MVDISRFNLNSNEVANTVFNTISVDATSAENTVKSELSANSLRKPGIFPRGNKASSNPYTQGEVNFYLVRSDFANSSFEELTAGSGPISRVWKFTCAPSSVRWSKSGEASTISSYATNSPAVIYSQTSLRQLTLSEVLVEGFSYGNEILSVIKELESLMTIVSNSEKGYAAPYVYSVKANESSYGLYVITSLEVEEYIRDSRGQATRAVVSIQLLEVPAYQVNTGRDLALPGDLANPDQEALDALSPDEDEDSGGTPSDGSSQSEDGGIQEDELTTDYKIVQGATGAIATQGQIKALCKFETGQNERICIPESEEDAENFRKMGLENGDDLGNGVILDL